MKETEIIKNTGFCPFQKETPECREGCALYVETTRVYDSGMYEGETFILKGCCLTMLWAETGNQSQRQAMMQEEMGQTKQAALLQAIATLFDSDQSKQELARLIKRNYDDLGLLDHFPEGN